MLVALALLLSPPTDADAVRGVKVLNDRAPDTSSLASIVESVTQDCETDDGWTTRFTPNRDTIPQLVVDVYAD